MSFTYSLPKVRNSPLAFFLSAAATASCRLILLDGSLLPRSSLPKAATHDSAEFERARCLIASFPDVSATKFNIFISQNLSETINLRYMLVQQFHCYLFKNRYSLKL